MLRIFFDLENYDNCAGQEVLDIRILRLLRHWTVMVLKAIDTENEAFDVVRVGGLSR